MKFSFRTIPLIVLALLVSTLFPATLAARESQGKRRQMAARTEQSVAFSVEQVTAEPGMSARVERFSRASERGYLKQDAATANGRNMASGQIESSRRARDNTVSRVTTRARSGTNQTRSDSGSGTNGQHAASAQAPPESAEADAGPSFNALNQTLGWRS